MPKVTQKDRVERALHRTGKRGITQADFIGQVIVDGGAPITRLAARIDELKQSGLKIIAAGHRDGGCVIYRLEEHAAPSPAPTPPPAPLTRPAAQDQGDDVQQLTLEHDIAA